MSRVCFCTPLVQGNTHHQYRGNLQNTHLLTTLLRTALESYPNTEEVEIEHEVLDRYYKVAVAFCLHMHAHLYVTLHNNNSKQYNNYFCYCCGNSKKSFPL